MTAQAYYNKHIVTIIHQLLAGGKNTGNSTIRKICEDIGLKSSNFWQTDIPEKFINKTFGELYDEFCENNLVILGLYRLHGARDNNTGYINEKFLALALKGSQTVMIILLEIIFNLIQKN